MRRLAFLFSSIIFALAFHFTSATSYAQMVPNNCEGQMNMDGMSMPQPSCPPAPTPTVAVNPDAANTVAVRKNIYSLTPDELNRLVNALNTVRANGSYNRFMDEHMQAMMMRTPADDTSTLRNAAHRGPVFLPWHRAFVWEFEQLLRTVDPTVTVPYWAFENETAGTIPLVFSAGYFGGDGNIAQADRVTDGPFASWGIVRRLGRDPQGQSTLPNAGDIASILQINEYDTPPYNESSTGFRNSIEGWTGTNAPWGIHNRVHGYVGGDMLPDGMSGNAVNDPIFWLVHANIDRIWWQWQQTHGITNYQPIVGGPEGHNLNDIMFLLPSQGTAANTLDINQMNYTYN